METTNVELFNGQSDLTISELLDKLREVTAEDFESAKKSRNFQYYGKINGNTFDICNVKFGPHSTGPSIQGKIEETPNKKTLLNFNVDIEEHKSYVNTIIALAVLVVGIFMSLFTLVGSEDMFVLLSIAAVMTLFPLLYLLMVRLILKSTQKNELKKFTAITKSKLTYL
jgi:hypothetical protein